MGGGEMIGQSIGGPPGNDGSGPERIAGRLHAGPPVSPSNGYLWPPYKSRGRAKRRIKPAPKRKAKRGRRGAPAARARTSPLGG